MQSKNHVVIQTSLSRKQFDQLSIPVPLMRPLTEEETKVFFEKLAK